MYIRTFSLLGPWAHLQVAAGATPVCINIWSNISLWLHRLLYYCFLKYILHLFIYLRTFSVLVLEKVLEHIFKLLVPHLAVLKFQVIFVNCFMFSLKKKTQHLQPLQRSSVSSFAFAPPCIQLGKIGSRTWTCHPIATPNLWQFLPKLFLLLPPKPLGPSGYGWGPLKQSLGVHHNDIANTGASPWPLLCPWIGYMLDISSWGIHTSDRGPWLPFPTWLAQ